MRIIAGERGGAQLYAPRGMDTRPTQDKVKESLFSIIHAYVPGARVLDLFAGSGALALEALSRGADRAALADRDREAAACIRRNVEKLRFAERARLYAADWRQAVSQMQAEGRRFDLVFLDPPYASGLLQQALTDIAAFDICRAHGIIIAESAVDTVLPEMPAPYALYREYRYGKIKLTVYHRGGNEDTE